MHPETHRTFDPNRYRKATEASRRIAFDIDNDVFRGRRFDFSSFLLPDGLSKLSELEFLGDGDRRLMSQIQGRTYANMFGLVERFISAKVPCWPSPATSNFSR
jgi:hypothetical protein